MQYWEIIADKFSAAGWSWGYYSAVARDGWRWIVDAQREAGGGVELKLREELSHFASSKVPAQAKFGTLERLKWDKSEAKPSDSRPSTNTSFSSLPWLADRPPVVGPTLGEGVFHLLFRCLRE
jgi:hypothetical protein